MWHAHSIIFVRGFQGKYYKYVVLSYFWYGIIQGVSQYALIKKYGVSPGQITRMKRNESVSTHTIEMFCRILDCDVGEIMGYIPDE